MIKKKKKTVFSFIRNSATANAEDSQRVHNRDEVNHEDDHIAKTIVSHTAHLQGKRKRLDDALVSSFFFLSARTL